ncbi:MAG: hypothetical protein GX685_03750 [Clostridiales bacterium]|nr:hypothetical protein [Clostridiales bacterium]
MDKYEYKVRLDDIKSLITQRDFAQALEIADSIDWTHVKSVKTLCMISDLYKINGKIQESYAVLLQAYNFEPEDPKIIYALCELLLRQKQMLPALQLYNEFTRISPRDPSRFVLQYQLYQLQHVSIDERISVLKELERVSFRDKWVFELARIYEENSRYQECVAECDKLIAKGKPSYQKKAIQLKQKYSGLTGEQNEIYRQLVTTARRATAPITEPIPQEEPAPRDEGAYEQESSAPVRRDTGNEPNMDDMVDRAARITGIAGTEPMSQVPEGESDIHVKQLDEKLVSTVDLQREVADGLKDIMTRETGPIEREAEQRASQEKVRRVFNNGFDLPEEAEKTPEKKEQFEQARQKAKVVRERMNVEPQQTESRENRYNPYLAQDNDGQMSMRLDPEVRVAERAAKEAALRPAHRTFSTEMPENAETEEEATAKLQAYDEDRADRIREAAPNGGLSDGMTGNEKFQVALAGQANEAPENKQNALEDAGVRDTLVMDPSAVDAATRTWSAPEVNGAAGGVKIDKEIEQPLHFVEPVGKETDTMNTSEAATENEEDKLSETQEIAALVARQFANDEKLAAERAAAEAARKAEEEAARQAEIEAAAKRILAEREKKREAAEEQIKIEAEEKARKAAAEAARKAEIEAAAKRLADEEEARLSAQRLAAEKQIAEKQAAAKAAAEKAEAEKEAADEEPADEQPADEQPETDDDKEAAHEKTVEAVTEALQGVPADPQETEIKHDKAEVKPAKHNSEADRIRNMTPEQRKMFGPFLHEKNTRAQLLRTIDEISLASYTGNVIITGDEGTGTLDLAKVLLRNEHLTDSNFSGKVAVTNGAGLSKKGPSAYFSRLENGGLIVDKAYTMTRETVNALNMELEKEDHGIIVILVGSGAEMDKFYKQYESRLKDLFTTRIDVKTLSTKELINYAQHYANRQDCSIDAEALPELESVITSMQSATHHVTVEEVRDIVDEAIGVSEKKTPGHLFDSMKRKRYDSEDRMILHKKDFTH